MMDGMKTHASFALAAYRAENDLSQAAFAAMIGVTSSIVSRYEAGIVKPDLDRAIAIEKATSGAVPVGAWGQE